MALFSCPKIKKGGCLCTLCRTHFLTAAGSNTRKYRWTGTITTTAGKTYDFENKDIVQGSWYITRECCSSSEIELGTVYAAEMGITLFSEIDRYTLDEAEVRIYYHLTHADGSEESIPMGVFEISEANRNIKTLELKAYDYMLRFEKTLKLESSSGSPTMVLDITFTSKESTTAMFLGELLLDITADEVIRTIDGTAIYDESSADEDGTETTENIRRLTLSCRLSC